MLHSKYLTTVKQMLGHKIDKVAILLFFIHKRNIRRQYMMLYFNALSLYKLNTYIVPLVHYPLTQ